MVQPVCSAASTSVHKDCRHSLNSMAVIPQCLYLRRKISRDTDHMHCIKLQYDTGKLYINHSS